jgi:hypothetical protein
VTRKQWLLIVLGVMIVLAVIAGIQQLGGQKQSAHKQIPEKEPYVVTFQVGKVYRQDDDYLKLIDESHYIRLMHTEWSENPDNEAEPNRPSYVYGSGVYTRTKNLIQLGPTPHWLQLKFHNRKAVKQRSADKIQEFMEYRFEDNVIIVKGFPETQLRIQKGHWQIVEDPPGYLHPSNVKLPNTIEAAKNQFITKKYERYE